jgi:hypothetical protein
MYDAQVCRIWADGNAGGLCACLGRIRLCAVRLRFRLGFGGRLERGLIALWFCPGVARRSSRRPCAAGCAEQFASGEPQHRHHPRYDAWQHAGARHDPRSERARWLTTDWPRRAADDPSSFGFEPARTGTTTSIAAIAADRASRHIWRRQRTTRLARLVSGQRERSQRAGRWRQELSRLHGLLGARHAHDEAGVEGSLPAYDRPAESLAVLTHRSLRLRQESIR